LLAAEGAAQPALVVAPAQRLRRHAGRLPENLPKEAPVIGQRVVRENALVSQATLQTSRIRLVPLSDEHLEHEIELDSDPEVMRYLGNGQARAHEEVEAVHRGRLTAASRVPGLGFWAGFVDEEFVGWWILQPPERADQGPVEGQAELGYRLLRRHWRKGLASEGARELIRHGFEALGLTRVFAETMAVNAASRATMAAVGMQHMRTFHVEWEVPLPAVSSAKSSTRSHGSSG
jgi:RimJ/RimL family protein N-acetyltransferase